jgi:uroporphyrinogen decarboxylase
MREFCRQAHDAGVRVMHHTCGAVFELVEDLIDVGVDILNPVQTSAEGMDPAMLKKRFGGRISFHGSVDTQRTLPKGSPGEVRSEVRARVEVLGSGGGLILAPTHNLQPDVPTENIIAMYSEATGLTIRV